MKTKIFTLAAISAFLLTTAITTQAGDSYNSKSSGANSSAANPPADSTAQSQMKAGMGSDCHGMDHSKMKGTSTHNMPMSGDPDKDFAMMMKMHHQQGLEMSEKQLQQGKSAEMKAMARKIIDAQKKEIAQLDRFLGNQQP